MIAFLTGRVARKGDGFALIEVGGVGYRLAMSSGSLAALPSEGDEVTVLTHMHVREDEMSLFGFESEEEKELFEKLIGVGSVGPKLALAVLSSFRPPALAEAIAREDVALVSSVPGVGKKTAQRIILELKDKLGVPEELGMSAVSAEPAALDAARRALGGMGFSAAEIASALKGYEGDGGPEDMLHHALRRLGGGV